MLSTLKCRTSVVPVVALPTADTLPCLFCGNLCCASCRLCLRPFAFAPHRHTLCGWVRSLQLWASSDCAGTGLQATALASLGRDVHSYARATEVGPNTLACTVASVTFPTWLR
eukprot:354219-Chlamydomonas_euryale.AAC.2